MKISPTFCILPWIHMFLAPGGEVLPCCIGDWRKPLGNWRKDKLQWIWNNAAYRELRRRMISGMENENCRACQRDEATGGRSFRQNMNSIFKTELKTILNSEGASSVDFSWKYMDVRFSNLCNFKCRTCNRQYSSQWAEEDRRFSNKILISDSLRPSYALLPQILGLLPSVKIINFAGGEPLIMPEHYQLLAHLFNSKHTKIKIRYSTNLSTLRNNQIDVVDLWKQFPDITAVISLDAFRKRAEYIRFGSNWHKQIDNIYKIQKDAPHVKIRYSCVVSLFNVSIITDMLDCLADKNIVDINQDIFAFYLLKDPQEFDITVLDENTRNIASLKILDWIKNRQPHQNLKEKLKAIVGRLRHDSHHLGVFARSTIDSIDARRGECFCATFPELINFYNLCDYSKGNYPHIKP